MLPYTSILSNDDVQRLLLILSMNVSTGNFTSWRFFIPLLSLRGPSASPLVDLTPYLRIMVFTPTHKEAWVCWPGFIFVPYTVDISTPMSINSFLAVF